VFRHIAYLIGSVLQTQFKPGNGLARTARAGVEWEMINTVIYHENTLRIHLEYRPEESSASRSSPSTST
jgi:hypothetical protein